MNGLFDFDRGGDEHIAECQRSGANMADAVKDEPAGGGVDQVDYIVHSTGQFVNVFAIERSNESLIQFAENLMRDFIAGVLDRFDALDLFGNTCVMLQHANKCLSARDDVFGLPLEENEEISVLR